MILEKLKYLFFKVYYDWEIGIIQNEKLDVFLGSISPKYIKWFHSKKDVYQADPFAIEKDGMIYLFYEEYSRIKNYGYICCAVLNHNLEIIEKQLVIDDGSHKSFPYLFTIDDNLYMMPESVASNSLDIYRCVKFPFQWEIDCTILNSPCSDAIIFQEKNLWHLLYTKGNSTEENLNLYLRVNDNPFLNWDSTKEMLVKSDLSSSRNAGKLFIKNNRTYRSSQDCTNRYGEKIIINEVLNFNFESYTEIKIVEINFNEQGIFGPHTINFTRNYTFLDRQFERRILKSWEEIAQTFRLILKKKNKMRV
jgi:hypothetical protein